MHRSLWLCYGSDHSEGHTGLGCHEACPGFFWMFTHLEGEWNRVQQVLYCLKVAGWYCSMCLSEKLVVKCSSKVQYYGILSIKVLMFFNSSLYYKV